MSETQKIKRVGSAFLPLGVFPFKIAEAYVAALVRVYFQSVFVEPILQPLHYASGIICIANYTNKIIAV